MQDAYQTRPWRPDRPHHDLHGSVAVAGGLHEDTEPDAIARRQRAAVAEAWRAGARTVEAISNAVILPAWTVRRRLTELGKPVAPAPVGTKKVDAAGQMARALVGGRVLTSREIAEATGQPIGTVECYLRKFETKRFVRVPVPPAERRKMGPLFRWRLKSGEWRVNGWRV